MLFRSRADRDSVFAAFESQLRVLLREVPDVWAMAFSWWLVRTQSSSMFRFSVAELGPALPMVVAASRAAPQAGEIKQFDLSLPTVDIATGASWVHRPSRHRSRFANQEFVRHSFPSTGQKGFTKFLVAGSLASGIGTSTLSPLVETAGQGVLDMIEGGNPFTSA